MIKQLEINKMKNLNYKIMRKFAFTLLMLLTLSLSAQDGIIKFKGIPVDGTKDEMIIKLKQKGFTYDYTNDMFKGVFDGDNIVGFIQTYNGKVYNIRFVHDSHGFNKSVVINKFNSLVLRYETNEKYLSNIKLDKAINDIDTYQIDSYEDIGNEMKRGKTYKAQYYYTFDKDLSDTTGLYQFKIETIRKYQNLASTYGRNLDDFINDTTLPVLYYMHKLEQDMVQFYIIDGMDYDTYLIMFDYSNRRNAPNGDDL